MNTKPVLLAGMLVLALAQLGVPLSMIARREATLRDGKVFRFKTAPVDPYDAFRGRYVALGVEERKGPLEGNAEYRRGQRVYALLEEDGEGFARIRQVVTARPDEGDYIAVRGAWGRDKDGNLQVHWPFNRYYMNEELAPRAERVYREHSRRGKHDAYITVRVKGGFAVLEELYISDKPIGEFLADE